MSTTDAALRSMDVLLAGVLLVVGMPVLVVFATALALGSRGPVLHRQMRVGRDGEPFLMLKLRTMVATAEDGTGPVLSSWRDPRLVRGGGLTRALHVDGLPQVWHVLRGQMSMVGPRPERPEFVALLAAELPRFADRHAVRPGLTGVAQIRGGYHCDPATKLAHDLSFVDHRTVGRYLRVLAETPVGIAREAWQNRRRARAGDAHPASVLPVAGAAWTSGAAGAPEVAADRGCDRAADVADGAELVA